MSDASNSFGTQPALNDSVDAYEKFNGVTPELLWSFSLDTTWS